MKIRPGLEIASLTDVGCQREGNEDSYGYWEPDDDTLFSRLGRLAVVADGREAMKADRLPVALRLTLCRKVILIRRMAAPHNLCLTPSTRPPTPFSSRRRRGR